MNESIANFYEIDPPLNTESCAGIYRCKDNYYEDYIGYIRNLGIDTPLFISEIGSQSCEYSAYSQASVFLWDEKKNMTGYFYGITNIRDYQEQVDMVEGDVMVFLGNDALRGSKKLKGVIIFSDDLLPENSQLFWYNFPPTGKPLDKFIPLLTGKGVR